MVACVRDEIARDIGPHDGLADTHRSEVRVIGIDCCDRESHAADRKF